jgi:hypothetical protein
MATEYVAFAALDFWSLFVNYTFGNFYLAVLGISILFWFLLSVFGGLSGFTTLGFIAMFMLSMSLGYGYPFWSLLTTVGLLVLAYVSVVSWVASRA